jgi:hypothetical protein
MALTGPISAHPKHSDSLFGHHGKNARVEGTVELVGRDRSKRAREEVDSDAPETPRFKVCLLMPLWPNLAHFGAQARKGVLRAEESVSTYKAKLDVANEQLLKLKRARQEDLALWEEEKEELLGRIAELEAAKPKPRARAAAAKPAATPKGRGRGKAAK